MINRKWVLHICEMQSYHIFSYDQKTVSDNAHFVKGNLIMSYDQQLVSDIHILWKAVSQPTGSEWHGKFCEGQSHHILVYFPHDNQGVSDAMAYFCERQFHHIFSYDLQIVSDVAHFVKGSVITSISMANSLWVILHIIWKAVSSHILLPTGSEWCCTFVKHSLTTSVPLINSLWVTLYILERQSYPICSYDQQGVNDIVHFVKGSLITSFPMINRLWVTLHILWKAVSSHLFLWPTDCEWHCTFCKK